MDPSVRAPMRAQGVLISDGEIENVIIDYWQQVYEQMEQNPEEMEAPWEEMVQAEGENIDEMFEQVVRFVLKTGRANASLIQREFHVGYPRAASLIDQMEARDIVGPSRGGGRDREILISSYQEYADDQSDGSLQDRHPLSSEERTNDTTDKPKLSFSDRLRSLAQPLLNFTAKSLLSIGLTPNTVTVIGALGNIIPAVLIATGHLTWGGAVALFWVLFDAVDGSMARLSNQVSKAGAFLDSTFDRYVEFFLLTGTNVVLPFDQPTPWSIACMVITLAGSILISYTRARAEGLGFECKVGLLTRVERFIIFIPSLLFQIPMVGLSIMAVLTHVTAVQRILHVVQQARESK